MPVNRKRKHRNGLRPLPPREDSAPKKKNGNRRKPDPVTAEPAAPKRKKARPKVQVRVPKRIIKPFLALLISLAAAGAVICGGAICLVKAYRFCTTNSYFAITDISVSGVKQSAAEGILEAAGIEKGRNSLDISIRDVEQSLMKDPWIENVSVKRDLPGKITISVQERIPQFCARKNGVLYYVNPDGEIIAPVSKNNFLSLPVLEIGPGGEENLHAIAGFLEEFKHAGFPFDVSQISWVRVSAGGGFELYWENRHLRLGIGVENWKDNLKRMASVVTDIEARKETYKVTGIKAADGQVWMTKAAE